MSFLACVKARRLLLVLFENQCSVVVLPGTPSPACWLVVLPPAVEALLFYVPARALPL